MLRVDARYRALPRLAALAVVLGTLAVPRLARADDDDDQDAPAPGVDDDWHGDAMLFADLPLAASTFRAAASIGGGIELRVYKGLLDLELQNALFAAQDSKLAERIRYRNRLMGGLRWSHGIASNRQVIGRVDAGIELAGWDPVGSATFVAARHELGFAGEVSIESRSQFDWGIVTLSAGLDVSDQPFADSGSQKLNYIGLEAIAGAAVGF